MPIPVVIGIVAAAVAGVAGVGAGVDGGRRVIDAKDREAAAKELHEDNMRRFDDASGNCNSATDWLGRIELETLESFEGFSALVARIQNAPEFEEICIDGVCIPQFDSESLREVSVAAKAMLSGAAGAAAGALSGVAASGATTAIVAALGTASTGTAISTLSGAAAANATLAALGGGSLAAGGGGMAMGTAVLGGAAAGAGLLVAGVVINIVGRNLSNDVDELCAQVEEEKNGINRVCDLLWEIRNTADQYNESLQAVRREYLSRLDSLNAVVGNRESFDWNEFTPEEKQRFENMVLLVGVLYKMCQVNLIIDIDDDGVADRVNHEGLDEMMATASAALSA